MGDTLLKTDQSPKAQESKFEGKWEGKAGETAGSHENEESRLQMDKETESSTLRGKSWGRELRRKKDAEHRGDPVQGKEASVCGYVLWPLPGLLLLLQAPSPAAALGNSR